MSGTTALGQHGNTVEHRCRHGAATDPHAPWNDLDVADDAAGKSGHKPVGRIVVGVIDGSVKLGLRRRRR